MNFKQTKYFHLFSEEKILPRLIKFCIVGITGVAVNMGLLALFREIFKFPIWLASPIAIEMSIISNFLLNDVWTWNDRRYRTMWGRLWRYHLSIGITAFGLNYPILLIMTYIFGVPYLLSNLVGICISALANFLLNHLWTYKDKSHF
ncbi:hypothetical protein DRQ33_03240 [bacterium]|nr:MAG: hypothetical protein DRQ33_03240 [bacterium]